MKFHLTKQAREIYSIDLSNFIPDGSTRFINLSSLRSFVHQYNQQNEVALFPEKAIKTSQVNAVGVIHEVFHHMFIQYRTEKNIDLTSELKKVLNFQFAESEIDDLLRLFISNYPPLDVDHQVLTPEQYLHGSSDGAPNQLWLLEEIILLWVSTQNPALTVFSNLCWAPEIIYHKSFLPINKVIENQFSKLPGYGPENQSLIEMFKLPALLHPKSITQQLEYIRDHWGQFLGDTLAQILGSLDLAKEEEKMAFMPGPGPIEIPVYDFGQPHAIQDHEIDIEAFSEDKDWMPRLVLIAKNIYVWLDQLSKQYGYPITRLDEIPDDELHALSDRGITGLWLIGLWQRSPASARIKQLCGNPEATASAYSLFTYRIADILGGDEACERLRDKASRYGIRLASDMVPNHMGIDSEWVIQHPEWFLSLEESPFPSYSFTGPDLSSDPNIQIQIEDHYYDRTDAAVVFRRQNKESGEIRYIYHGNDGTSMPWNDTAQLNYLDPVVREMVIKTIIEVARKFPIIRFDAAMTLAKKHIQRLWYPEPGQGGAIPSRSAFSLSKADFDQCIPEEFWREVVERVEAEVPGTLLLAEAFWLMEGYFVRSLGMHRVYNSAFMHMLRNEDNAGYRSLMKNTLEFEPEILKRFVNFMNNPDEKTAIEQFGSGDKYFGICTLMTAMPGLPMFGHGQIEGFTEKYGMEYSRAYLDEQVDEALVDRHLKEIIPLLYHRELFSGVNYFAMYDFCQNNGKIDENVFVFTNRLNDARTLVIYNNRFLETTGWIDLSLPSVMGKKHEKTRTTSRLFSALGIRKNDTGYLQFYDLTTHQFFLRPVEEIINQGWSIHLNGYEHHVFVEFKVVQSNSTHNYDQVFARYRYNGFSNLEQALQDVKLEPVLFPLREIINPGFYNFLITVANQPNQVSNDFSNSLSEKVQLLTNGIKIIYKDQVNESLLANEFTNSFSSLINILNLKNNFSSKGTKNVATSLERLTTDSLDGITNWYILITWTLLKSLGVLFSKNEKPDSILRLMEEWKIDQLFEELCQSQGMDKLETQKGLSTIRLMTLMQGWFEKSTKMIASELVKEWLNLVEVQLYLGFNRYDGKIWYNMEAFHYFLWIMEIMPVLQAQSRPNANLVSIAEIVLNLNDIFSTIRKLDSTSNCQVERLLRSDQG